MRTAAATRSPTAIVPNDVQELEYEPPARTHGRCSPRRLRTAGARAARRASDEAAAILNAGSKVAMLSARARSVPSRRCARSPSGSGAAWPRPSTAAALSDELPYVTGAIGLLGTKPSYDMMETATRS